MHVHASVLMGEKVLMGGFHAERKHEVGGPYAWPKPALRGRPRPPGRPLAPPRASWVVWWRARRRAWPGVASRYRPREKAPKNTYLENPILTLPSYMSASVECRLNPMLDPHGLPTTSSSKNSKFTKFIIVGEGCRSLSLCGSYTSIDVDFENMYQIY
jgi:hypothetical protein